MKHKDFARRNKPKTSESSEEWHSKPAAPNLSNSFSNLWMNGKLNVKDCQYFTLSLFEAAIGCLKSSLIRFKTCLTLFV